MSKSKDAVPVNRPPFTANYISRNAVEASREENFGLALTVVSAWAGYNKSSLISRRLANSNLPVTSQNYYPQFNYQR